LGKTIPSITLSGNYGLLQQPPWNGAMPYQHLFYPESNFGGYTDIDGTITFYNRVNTLVQSDSVILDIGCGRGQYAEDEISWRRHLRIMKGKCQKVIGIDVNPAAQNNPFLDEFWLIPADYHFPVPNESIDLALADWVLEHVQDPALFFAECRRAIKPDGFLCIRTINVWGYAGLLARLIPNRFHARILGKAQRNKKEEDTFPTVYRCNTIGKIKEMMENYGLDSCVYGYESEPQYCAFSKVLYRLAVWHQKLAPKGLKTAIFAFGKKR